jgi:hypothetical protein
LYYDYLQHKTSENLEALIDNNSYDESQLMELKIPINLPYQTSWTAYQRYDGEIKLNGTIYKYVKRKLSNDTLYLMCIPNSNKMRLETAKNDFFKLTNDFTQNDNSKKQDNSKSASKNLQTVYNETSFGIHLQSPISLNQHLWLSSENEDLLSTLIASPWQPPDLLVG